MSEGFPVLADLEVYSRQGCHLCEHLIDELAPMIRGRLRLVVRDIDTNPEWSGAYGELIPVVRFEGREICRYHLDRPAIVDLLNAVAPPNQAS